MVKKRILCLDDHVIHVFDNDGHKTGGASVQLYSWIRGWTGLGNEVYVLNNYTNRRVNDQLSFVQSYKPEAGIKGLRWFYYRLPKMLKQIRRIQADIIYQSGFAWETYFFIRLSKRLKTPFILRISNDIYADSRWEEKQSNPFKKRLARLALRAATFLVVQNNYQLEQLSKRFPDKKIIKITNPFLVNRDSSDQPANVGSYIAWIGLFQKQKNLTALAEIARQNPDFQFQVAGKILITNDQDTLLEIKALESLSNVKMVGYLKRDEVPLFLSQAICLLNTSHFEGFSNTFLEAFAAGTPVVTTAQVNPDQIVEKYGLGVVSESHAQLSDTLAAFLGQADELESFAQNCREYVRLYHDPVDLSRQLLNFIDAQQS